MDLTLRWDAPLGCLIKIDGELSRERRQELSHAQFMVSSDLGTILTGTVPLVYAPCLPDLPFVVKVDCGSGNYGPENEKGE